MRFPLPTVGLNSEESHSNTKSTLPCSTLSCLFAQLISAARQIHLKERTWLVSQRGRSLAPVKRDEHAYVLPRKDAFILFGSCTQYRLNEGQKLGGDFSIGESAV
jgi:hypothetical protein